MKVKIKMHYFTAIPSAASSLKISKKNPHRFGTSCLYPSVWSMWSSLSYVADPQKAVTDGAYKGRREAHTLEFRGRRG